MAVQAEYAGKSDDELQKLLAAKQVWDHAHTIVLSVSCEESTLSSLAKRRARIPSPRDDLLTSPMSSPHVQTHLQAAKDEAAKIEAAKIEAAKIEAAKNRPNRPRWPEQRPSWRVMAGPIIFYYGITETGQDTSFATIAWPVALFGLAMLVGQSL
eukprot:2742450-Prymnesium_polylepis.1